MDCQDTSELLPWLLNGTLDPAEEGEVREHLAGCADCRRGLTEAAFAWAVFDQHPEPQALVDLAFGRPAADPDRLRTHLEACPRCAEELALVRRSRALGGAEEGRVVPLLPTEDRGWRRLAAAAGVAFLISASGWLWTWQRGTERREIEVNVPVLDVLPQERTVRRAGPEVNRLTVPAGARSVVLILASESDREFPEYAWEMVDRSGRAVAGGGGLVRNPGTLDYTLRLPVELLPHDRFMLRVYGESGGRRTEVETYEFYPDR